MQRMQKYPFVPRLFEVLPAADVGLPASAPPSPALVMQILGPNLSQVRKAQPGKRLAGSAPFHMGLQMLTALEALHREGFVHQDVKPSNFCTSLQGVVGGPSPPPFTPAAFLNILDFGLARRYVDEAGNPLPLSSTPTRFFGTSRYASMRALAKLPLGRLDDMWSLLYAVLELALPDTPWRKASNATGISSSAKHERVLKLKRHHAEHPCALLAQHGVPPPLALPLLVWQQHLRRCKPDAKPDYGLIAACLSAAADAATTGQSPPPPALHIPSPVDLLPPPSASPPAGDGAATAQLPTPQLSTVPEGFFDLRLCRQASDLVLHSRGGAWYPRQPGTDVAKGAVEASPPSIPSAEWGTTGMALGIVSRDGTPLVATAAFQASVPPPPPPPPPSTAVSTIGQLHPTLHCRATVLAHALFKFLRVPVHVQGQGVFVVREGGGRSAALDPDIQQTAPPNLPPKPAASAAPSAPPKPPPPAVPRSTWPSAVQRALCSTTLASVQGGATRDAAWSKATSAVLAAWGPVCFSSPFQVPEEVLASMRQLLQHPCGAAADPATRIAGYTLRAALAAAQGEGRIPPLTAPPVPLEDASQEQRTPSSVPASSPEAEAASVVAAQQKELESMSLVVPVESGGVAYAHTPGSAAAWWGSAPPVVRGRALLRHVLLARSPRDPALLGEGVTAEDVEATALRREPAPAVAPHRPDPRSQGQGRYDQGWAPPSRQTQQLQRQQTHPPLTHRWGGGRPGPDGPPFAGRGRSPPPSRQ